MKPCMGFAVLSTLLQSVEIGFDGNKQTNTRYLQKVRYNNPYQCILFITKYNMSADFKSYV